MGPMMQPVSAPPWQHSVASLWHSQGGGGAQAGSDDSALDRGPTHVPLPHQPEPAGSLAAGQPDDAQPGRVWDLSVVGRP